MFSAWIFNISVAINWIVWFEYCYSAYRVALPECSTRSLYLDSLYIKRITQILNFSNLISKEIWLFIHWQIIVTFPISYHTPSYLRFSKVSAGDGARHSLQYEGEKCIKTKVIAIYGKRGLMLKLEYYLHVSQRANDMNVIIVYLSIHNVSL